MKQLSRSGMTVEGMHLLSKGDRRASSMIRYNGPARAVTFGCNRVGVVSR